MRKGRALATLIAACLIVLLPQSQDAHAACASQQALTAMLTSPNNIEAVIQHARCAVEEGDYESAIATYEALLIYSPENAELELELAALYAKAGASSLAQAHYENVLEFDGISDELRRVAQQGIASLSFVGDDDFQLTHFVAWRHQDNANLGTSSAVLSVLGRTVNVPRNQQKRLDHSVWHEGGLSYRFGHGEAVNAWEVNLDWFTNNQTRGTSLNSILVTGDLGPEFDLSDIAKGASIRPYVSLTHSILQETTLYTAFGGGVVLAGQFTDQLSWESRYDYKQLAYDDNSLRTLSSTYDGWQFASSTELTYVVNDNLQFTASAGITRSDLKDDEYSYDGYEARLGATIDSGLRPFEAGSIVIDLQAGFERLDYWNVSTTPPGILRSDDHFNFTAEIDLPLTENVSFVQRTEFDKATSNDPFSEYEAWSIYFGARAGL